MTQAEQLYPQPSPQLVPLYGAQALEKYPKHQVALFDCTIAALAAEKAFGDRLVVVAIPDDATTLTSVDFSILTNRSVAVVGKPVLVDSIAEHVVGTASRLMVAALHDEEWRDGSVLKADVDLGSIIRSRGLWWKGSSKLKAIDGGQSPSAHAESTAQPVPAPATAATAPSSQTSPDVVQTRAAALKSKQRPFATFIANKYAGPDAVMVALFNDAAAAAAEVGAALHELPDLDGCWHYLPSKETGKNEMRHSYRGEMIEHKDGVVLPRITFRTFKHGGETVAWSARDPLWAEFCATKTNHKFHLAEDRSAEYAERAEKLRAEAAERRAKNEEQDQHGCDVAASLAQRIWGEAAPAPATHSYLVEKKIGPHGLRIATKALKAEIWDREAREWSTRRVVNPGDLLVPVHDKLGELMNLQRIFPKAPPQVGYTKLPIPGGRMKGGSYTIGTPEDSAHDEKGYPIVGVAEGAATGISVREAKGCLLKVAFSAGGMVEAARQARAENPHSLLLIIADNDATTKGNPGVAAATAAAEAVGGILFIPERTGMPELKCDANDLAVAEGQAVLRDAIDATLAGHGADSSAAKRATTKSSAQDPQMRDEDRRRQQQDENKRLQDLDTGAMIPSVLTVDEMLERCVWITVGKNVAYVTEERSTFIKYDEFRALTIASVTEFEILQNGKQVKKRYPTAELWQSDRRRRDAMAATFRPGAGIITADPKGVSAVNTWRPSKRWPTKADITAFVELVKYLFPDPIERNVFLDWLAHIEQKPGELPHFGWLHIAEHTGTGRNCLASVMARVFRGYTAPNVDLSALLESQFNGELGNCVLAIVDEVQEGGSEGGYRLAERLKKA